MKTIRSRGNLTTEQRLRFGLVRAGVNGWRIQAQDLPGSPDFVFDKAQLVVFVDGCFWHGCPKCYHAPKAAPNYWKDKLRANKARDKRVRNKLRRTGWQVVRIWEHELKNLGRVIERIEVLLQEQRKTEDNA